MDKGWITKRDTPDQVDHFGDTAGRAPSKPVNAI